MAKIYQVALAVMLPFSFAAAQQTITLNDGTQFQGRFVGGTPDLVTFVDQGGVRHRFGLRQIQSIDFSDRQNYGSNNNRYDSGNQPPPPQYRNDANNGYNPPPAQGGYNNNNGYNPNGNSQPASRGNGNAYATLPANTQIAVRTTEQIHTSGGTPGKTYPASIDQDVLDASGNVAVPRGSNALLVVRDIGNHQIVLDLQSVNVNGQRYALNTQDVTQSASNSNRGVGANKRTGEYVGGGAVLGTLLGAIAGGGKGAAIGALAGAAAGAGTQVLTKGSEVRVPAETVLNFQLDQPVYLYQ